MPISWVERIGDSLYFPEVASPGDTEISVVDVSDPTNPKEMGFYDLPGITFRINVAGDYAFVTNTSKGLCVIDISDPEKPKKVSED